MSVRSDPAVLASPPVAYASAAAIIRTFAAIEGADIDGLRGESKTARITLQRHELMYVLRQVTVMSLSQIGRWLGGRDMATVAAGVAKIEQNMAQDAVYAERIQRLVADIRLRAPTEGKGAAAPWMLPAALSILRDKELTDGEARRVALGFLEQLEWSYV